jgi:hypothetical protein
MKTPRELILERHRNAEAQLEKIRAEDLAAYVLGWPAQPVSERCATSRLARGIAEFWQESLRPWRKAWLGMAALWLIILAVNLAGKEPHRNSFASAPSPSPEVRTALREQKELMVQLLEPSGPVILSRPKTPGPRSERRQMVLAA